MAAADVSVVSGAEAARAASAAQTAVSTHPPPPPAVTSPTTVAVGRRVSFRHLGLSVEHVLLVIPDALADLAGEQSPEGVVEVPVEVVVEERVDERVQVAEPERDLPGHVGRGVVDERVDDVHDEEREPAYRETAHDDAQCLGSFRLLLELAFAFAVTGKWYKIS